MATEATQTERDTLVERIVGALGARIDVASIYLGDTLGLYRALADGSERFRFAAAAPVDGSRAVAYGAVFVTDQHDRLYALAEPA